MMHKAWLGMLIVALAVTACKDSADNATETGSKEAGSKESSTEKTGQPAAEEEGVPPPVAPSSPTEENAQSAVVPVAADLGRSEHSLSAGLLIRPGHPSAGGHPCVAFLVRPGAKLRSAWVWLGEGKEKKWVPLSLRLGPSRELIIGVLPAETDHPVFDLATAGPIPAALDSLLAPEWGDPLNPPPVVAPKADPETEKRERELQVRYQELWQEEIDLRQPLGPEDRRLPTPERRQLERERRERSDEIRREVSELKSEASRLGIRLRRATSGTPSLKSPGRAARIVSTPVNAARGGDSEAAPGLVMMPADASPASGILPGALLARATEGGLEVLGLQRLARLCEVRLGALTGHVRLPRPTSPSLHLRLSLEPSAFGILRMRAGAAPRGELPEDLSKAPVTANGMTNSSREWIEASLNLQGLQIEPGTTLDAAVEIQHPETEEWVRLEPVSLSWEADPAIVIRPVLKDSPVMTWSAPEPSSQSTEAQIAVATMGKHFEAKGLLRAIQAGGGYHLLVQTEKPPRLRVLDLRSEEWVGELALPEGEAIALCGADAERVFIVDPTRSTLSSYALPDFKPLQSVKLPDGSPPLRIAAGYNSHLMPLVLLSDRSVELRDPRTLEPSDAVINYQNASRQQEAGFSSATWSGNGELTASQLRSSPDGDRFLLAQSFQKKDPQPIHTVLELKRVGTDWALAQTSNGAIGCNGLLFFHGRVSSPGSSKSTRHNFKTAPRFLLPAVGPGIVAVYPSQAQVSFPPPPLRLAYHTSLAEPEPVLHSRAAALAGEILMSQSASEIELAEVLFVLPALGKMVSVHGGEIVFERFAGIEPDRQPPLLGAIPSATRGEKWSCPARDAAGKPLPLKLIEGPKGASVEEPGNLTWQVPLGYSLSEARFEIELGDPPLAQSFSVAVHGLPGANLRTPGQDEVNPIPVGRTIYFPEGIDQILPSIGGAVAAVISGGSRRATIIDLENHEITASYTSSSGIAAFGLGHRHLYVWHLDGNILETRELPALAPAAIKPLDTSSRLVGFLVGSAPNALSPLALFTTERNQTEARSIAPDTLELSAAVPVSKNLFENSNPPPGMAVHTPPGSGDGGTFFFARRVLIRSSSGEFEVAEIPASRTADTSSQFSADGTTFFQGDTATDLATRRSWSTKLGSMYIGSSIKSILWPDLNQATVLAVTKYQPDNPNSQSQNYRIHFLDADTQELRYELDQFFEWDQSVLPLFAGKLANARLLFDSRSGTLLTVSSDGMRLIARKLPLALPD